MKKELGCDAVGLDSAVDTPAQLKAAPNELWAVTTDLNIAIMSGLVLARYIRETSRTLPAMLATGNRTELTQPIFDSAGNLCVLDKSYAPTDLECTFEKIEALNQSVEAGGGWRFGVVLRLPTLPPPATMELAIP